MFVSRGSLHLEKGKEKGKDAYAQVKQDTRCIIHMSLFLFLRKKHNQMFALFSICTHIAVINYVMRLF